MMGNAKYFYLELRWQFFKRLHTFTGMGPGGWWSTRIRRLKKSPIHPDSSQIIRIHPDSSHLSSGFILPTTHSNNRRFQLNYSID